jgi:hypothetical protein
MTKAGNAERMRQVRSAYKIFVQKLASRRPLRRFKYTSSSFLGSTAQLRPWPPPQNQTEFIGVFSTIFFLTG